MTKVFVDGSQGTTGLRIHKRLSGRDDMQLLVLDEKYRKDPHAREDAVNASDIVFLCLPDDSARESVSFLKNSTTKIIDTSTAHRTDSSFAYGFAELSDLHREKIASYQKCSIPGCHATGFISLIYPLTEAGLIEPQLPLSCFSLTGYSGGGKPMIADYENELRDTEYDSPRMYAMEQSHKHLKEMLHRSGLQKAPIFSPVVADFYNGMAVTVPVFSDFFTKKISASELSSFYEEKYESSELIRVLPFGTQSGFFASNELRDYDGLEILVSGNDERMTLTARFDNLGKGACGAAIQCMNIMLGISETESLYLQGENL